MIPRSKSEKKNSYTAVPDSLGQQLAQTFSKNEEDTTEEFSVQNEPERQDIKEENITEQPQDKQKVSAAKKQNREGQINICIPPEIKTEWKVLFASCNVNMTQGITFAIEHLKHEIDNGEAILTIGGVISKRK